MTSDLTTVPPEIERDLADAVRRRDYARQNPDLPQTTTTGDLA